MSLEGLPCGCWLGGPHRQAQRERVNNPGRLHALGYSVEEPHRGNMIVGCHRMNLLFKEQHHFEVLHCRLFLTTFFIVFPYRTLPHNSAWLLYVNH